MCKTGKSLDGQTTETAIRVAQRASERNPYPGWPVETRCLLELSSALCLNGYQLCIDTLGQLISGDGGKESCANDGRSGRMNTGGQKNIYISSLYSACAINCKRCKVIKKALLFTALEKERRSRIRVPIDTTRTSDGITTAGSALLS
ncbi:uncharacterized protein H6S33_003064 [Morchella sextelata]|uniref:uncharacterized protein n=1 Tax=Morchella sextelata TaxID=1174677 RepID=UPI001D058C8D|nr:uncharacterized protein H6S33_003064 [Morchella sextelata]KAH0607076.1 hypothetical protein H6S33_003064 [Morchella sextelata]